MLKCLKIDVLETERERAGYLWWCQYHKAISSADLLLWVAVYSSVSCRGVTEGSPYLLRRSPVLE